MNSKPKKYYAHSKEGYPPEEWQPLEEHLHNVAKLAAEFAKPFGAEHWAYLAGLWHDIGKASKRFQSYIHGDTSNTTGGDHSTAGAITAVENINILGFLLAYICAGHHSGLPNGIDAGSSLQKRLKKDIEESAEYFAKTLTTGCKLNPPIGLTTRPPNEFSVSMFTRFVFSALVDADFLDTESFMNPEQHKIRTISTAPDFHQLFKILLKFINKLPNRDDSINKTRSMILEHCIETAALKPGFFSLTVPTGGGKTLSSLAFALKHAYLHGKTRVIYVIPFTSIIEQNARVFRDVFSCLDKSVILEHHSNFTPNREGDTESDEFLHQKLSAENWDAPIVVTTAVQFFESIFANRSSKCRKLHNVANSVIIFDEAQSLPVQYIHPSLAALQTLVKEYSTSVILCTATQPEITYRDNFEIGIPSGHIREIIPNRKQLYINLKRVETEVIGKISDDTLVNMISQHRRALCIVNTRKHASKLYNMLCKKGQKDNCFHLSALMCPAHRTEILSQVKTRLQQSEEPCLLVSTQLIEAGVDIDFPVVFRSMAGLDSIVQAAGRCNRNGTLPTRGKLFIFQTENDNAESFFAETANCGLQTIACHKSDPLSLEAISHYFNLYYWEQTDKWDAKHILDEFKLAPHSPDFPFLFNFKTAAQKYKMIESDQKPIIIPWQAAGEEVAKRIRREHPNKNLSRALQRFTVNIHTKVWNRELRKSFELIHEQYPLLISTQLNYSNETGLFFDDEQEYSHAILS